MCKDFIAICHFRWEVFLTGQYGVKLRINVSIHADSKSDLFEHPPLVCSRLPQSIVPIARRSRTLLKQHARDERMRGLTLGSSRTSKLYQIAVLYFVFCFSLPSRMPKLRDIEEVFIIRLGQHQFDLRPVEIDIVTRF